MGLTVEQFSNLYKALNTFGEQLVDETLSNMNKLKMSSSGKLAKSLEYDVSESDGGLKLQFLMEEYGVYQDEGVSGTKKKYNTPFHYKDGGTRIRPPASAFNKWVVKKGLKGTRTKSGKFAPRKSIMFAVATNIWKFGIKPKRFFSDAWDTMEQKLNSGFLDDAIAIDIEKALLMEFEKGAKKYTKHIKIK